MNQVLLNIVLAAFIIASLRFLTCLQYLYQFLGYSCQPVCLQQTVPCRTSPLSIQDAVTCWSAGVDVERRDPAES